MPADNDTDDAENADDAEEAENAADIDDIKAKMRAALESKRAHDQGGDDQAHRKEEKPPETHGPLGTVHMHRRKAGGGGS